MPGKMTGLYFIKTVRPLCSFSALDERADDNLWKKNLLVFSSSALFKIKVALSFYNVIAGVGIIKNFEVYPL